MVVMMMIHYKVVLMLEVLVVKVLQEQLQSHFHLKIN
jgi:hypothetical protein